VIHLQHAGNGPHAQALQVHLVRLPLHFLRLGGGFDRNRVAVAARFALVTLAASYKTIFHGMAVVTLGAVHKNSEWLGEKNKVVGTKQI
jgi:hypothetical protein